MALLGIDVGTTHCKAGLCEADGTALHIASRPTPIHRTASGAYIEPSELWDVVAAVIHEAVTAQRAPIEAIGIASMAESGLIVETVFGEPRGPIIPWFDTGAQPQAEHIASSIDPRAL